MIIRLFVLLAVLISANTASATVEPWRSGRDFAIETQKLKQVPESTLAFFSRGITATATSTACPMGTGLGDGCPGNGGTFLIKNYNGGTNCFSGASTGGYLNTNSTPWLQTSGTLWANYRPAFNVVACDYGIGTTLSRATLMASDLYDITYTPDGGTTYPNLPTGCTIAVNYPGAPTLAWPYSPNQSAPMTYVKCGYGATKTFSFKDMYFGSRSGHHNAIGIDFSSTTTSATFDDCMWEGDASNVKSIVNGTGGYAGGEVGGVIVTGGSGTYTFKNVTALGNFRDGTGCCDSGADGLAMFRILTTGGVTISYSAMYNYLGYFFTSILTNPATFAMDHSYVDGCTQRVGMGHLECFTNSTALTSHTQNYNLWHYLKGMPTQQAFFHVDSNSANGQGTVNFDHVLMFGSSTGYPAAASSSYFHVENGSFHFDSIPPTSGGNLTVGRGSSVTDSSGALTLYDQTGTDANGWAIFSTDCAADQGPSGYCPGAQNSIESFTGSISSNVMTVSALVGYIPAKATITLGATANTKIIAQTSGTIGGVGVYTVDTSQLTGSAGSPVTMWIGTSGATAIFAGYIDNGAGSAGNQLTVTSVTSGTITSNLRLTALDVNSVVSRSSSVTITANTVITSLGTGTGGAGTYNVNNSQLVGSSASPVPLVVNGVSCRGYIDNGSGSAGTVLTIVSAAGTINTSPTTFTGTPTITFQKSGDTGGAGVYSYLPGGQTITTPMNVLINNVWMEVTASGTDLTVTKIHNAIPVGGTLTQLTNTGGTSIVSGTVVSSVSSAPEGGVGTYNISVPVNPAQGAQTTSGTFNINAGTFGNVANFPYVQTKTLKVAGFNYFFDWGSGSSTGQNTFTNLIIDTASGFFSTVAGSNGLQSPKSCSLTPVFTNNYDVSSGGVGAVTGFTSPQTGC